MTFNPVTLLICASCYFGALFMVAWVTRKQWIPEKVISHPLTYVLSLGVAISTWSFYTAVISASGRGFGYSAYYIGYSAAFLFAPVFLLPILHITRTYQLGSLADLFAFRFHSPWAGTLTTIVILICIFPLLSLQTLAVSASSQILVPGINPHLVPLFFTAVMILFTVQYGTDNGSERDKHNSIVISMAFESIVKLLVLGLLAYFAVFTVFGGFENLDQWLSEQPPVITRLDIPFLQDSSNLIVLLFFTAAITMPHMFHMVFHENKNPRQLKIASWGFPLFMLVASLPVLPVLWASEMLGSEINVQYSAIAITILKNSPVLTLIVFTGGIAAACGMVIVLAMSVSGMCMNHLLLRVHTPPSQADLYSWLLLRRKLFIVAIIAGGFLCYLLIADGSLVTDLGFVSFIACVQFLPGILTLLYWPDGNKKGFICGLLSGVAVWLGMGLLPMFTNISLTPLSYNDAGTLNWNLITSMSLLSNMLVMIGVSLLYSSTEGEKTAGQMCSMNTIRQPQKFGLLIKTPNQIIDRLSAPLGKETARREVFQALLTLGLNETENRPYAILQLRGQVEANLSGLLGPTIARQIIERSLPFEKLLTEDSSLDLSFVESRLEAYPGNLSGIALDLDKLRRHHRQILQGLPIGVCSLDSSLTISVWNTAMVNLTGVSEKQAVGLHPSELEAPWNTLLIEFAINKNITHIAKTTVQVDGKNRWFSLHKASIDKDSGATEGQVILIEDYTETELLEAELVHSERLASVGRLAAGVAHEIGNPVTGIACLAQNIRDETEDSELREMAEQILQQTQRTSSIVQSLVSFSHSGEQQSIESTKEQVNIYKCAEDAINLLSLNQQDHNDITFINTCDPDVHILSDRQRLQQVFVNLFSNARDASESNSAITVTNSSNETEIKITITDTGCGIPEHIQNRIFEPFFTTKEPGKGTGLGLALVYSIVEDLGGSIQFISPLDKVSKKGTQAIVTFPCYYASPQGEKYAIQL